MMTRRWRARRANVGRARRLCNCSSCFMRPSSWLLRIRAIPLLSAFAVWLTRSIQRYLWRRTRHRCCHAGCIGIDREDALKPRLLARVADCRRGLKTSRWTGGLRWFMRWRCCPYFAVTAWSTGSIRQEATSLTVNAVLRIVLAVQRDNAGALALRVACGSSEVEGHPRYFWPGAILTVTWRAVLQRQPPVRLRGSRRDQTQFGPQQSTRPAVSRSMARLGTIGNSAPVARGPARGALTAFFVVGQQQECINSINQQIGGYADRDWIPSVIRSADIWTPDGVAVPRDHDAAGRGTRDEARLRHIPLRSPGEAGNVVPSGSMRPPSGSGYADRYIVPIRTRHRRAAIRRLGRAVPSRVAFCRLRRSGRTK